MMNIDNDFFDYYKVENGDTIYNIARDKIFLLPVNEVSNNAINIRYEPAKNHQTKDVKFEENYLIDNILNLS